MVCLCWLGHERGIWKEVKVCFVFKGKQLMKVVQKNLHDKEKETICLILLKQTKIYTGITKKKKKK